MTLVPRIVELLPSRASTTLVTVGDDSAGVEEKLGVSEGLHPGAGTDDIVDSSAPVPPSATQRDKGTLVDVTASDA
jgi:hypothetical protein